MAWVETISMHPAPPFLDWILSLAAVSRWFATISPTHFTRFAYWEFWDRVLGWMWAWWSEHPTVSCWSREIERNVLFNDALNTFHEFRILTESWAGCGPGGLNIPLSAVGPERERDVLFNDALNTFHEFRILT